MEIKIKSEKENYLSMTMMNKNAWELLDEALSQKNLEWESKKLSCGTITVDAGVHLQGGLDAGIKMAEIGMGGFGNVSLKHERITDKLTWPQIEVFSDQPLLACFLSQAAHWSIKVNSFQGMGSGPACLLWQEGNVGAIYDVKEESDCAVLILESDSLPGNEECQIIAQACQLEPEKLAIIAAPTSSLAGSVQIAARSIEVALHKLAHLNWDLSRLSSGIGSCLIAPPTGDNWTALGRTNDIMAYSAKVWLAIKDGNDHELSNLVSNLPASTSPDYGRPFLDVLEDAGDFYSIDQGLFAPAEIVLTNLSTGKSHQAGNLDKENLLTSLGL